MTLKQYVMGSVLDLSKKNKLLANEKPKFIHLTKEPFSVENGLVTPTLKLKRNVAKEYFGAQIDKMYEENIKIVAKR